MQRLNLHRKKSSGFTLIELMIVVVLISLTLAAVGISAYKVRITNVNVDRAASQMQEWAKAEVTYKQTCYGQWTPNYNVLIGNAPDCRGYWKYKSNVSYMPIDTPISPTYNYPAAPFGGYYQVGVGNPDLRGNSYTISYTLPTATNSSNILQRVAARLPNITFDPPNSPNPTSIIMTFYWPPPGGPPPVVPPSAVFMNMQSIMGPRSVAFNFPNCDLTTTPFPHIYVTIGGFVVPAGGNWQGGSSSKSYMLAFVNGSGTANGHPPPRDGNNGRWIVKPVWSSSGGRGPLLINVITTCETQYQSALPSGVSVQSTSPNTTTPTQQLENQNTSKNLPFTF